MLQKTRAITLHSFKYGESGIIAHLYTENFGRQSFLIHGVRKKNSTISSYLLQPLAILDIEVYFKEARDLQHIKEVKPSTYLHDIRFNIHKSTIAIFLSEILYKTLRESEPDKKLFDFLLNAIQLLDISKNGIENFHLIFLLQYTKFLGIYPIDNEDFIYHNAKSGLNLQKLLQHSLADLNSFILEYTERQELLDIINIYYKSHISGFGQIQSLKILREVFYNL
jgi:DNA repair protein RecO (recombination protein O)